MATIKERVEKYCDLKDISVRQFCERAGLSNGYFKKSTKSLSPETIDKITKAFPDLNIPWLVFEEGETLKESQPSFKGDLIPKEYASHTPVRVVTSTARAGFAGAYYADEYLKDMPTVLIESDKEYKGKYLAFEIDGDSMEPEYNKGDIVICREIPRDHWRTKLHYKDWDFVIAHGTQGIMLKEIIDHNIETGEIVCHSLNSELHSDFVLNLREVAYLYNVVEHRRLGRNTRRYR